MQMALFLLSGLKRRSKRCPSQDAVLLYPQRKPLTVGNRRKMKGAIIMQMYLDNYCKTFSGFDSMLTYHENQSRNTRWEQTPVNALSVAPLDSSSNLLSDLSLFAPGISQAAVDDTAKNLGLAIKFEHLYYPLRNTAFKSLADRAKISGSSLPKLKKPDLASVLNKCLSLHNASALLLIREEKVSATHSGDEKDYSVLAIPELMTSIQSKLVERFPGFRFENGYTDHSITSASWSLPYQQDEILGAYKKMLDAQGKATLASKLMPGIRFCTSDTGLASAKISALLLGLRQPIHIGGMLAVEHRSQATVSDFSKNLDMIFAQFGDAIAMLEKLTTIYLDYPVNAMTAICKKLAMPKKAALEAIGMFEVTIGNARATAHDIFMGLQEIIFTLKSEGMPEGKLLTVEENLARALPLRWHDYDLAKKVNY
jgi:hypothetical protein